MHKLLGVFIGTMMWWSLAYADEHWIEVASLHDGKTLEVHRSVEFKRGTSDTTSFFHFFPTTYSLYFEHPVLPVIIRWSGVDNVHPIAIDFVGNTPFLAVYGTTAGVIYRNSHLYGCPDIPYAFLKYDLEERKWSPIAAKDAPEVLNRANLASRWDSYWMKNGRLTSKEIAEENASAERKASGYYFNKVIPRSTEEWRYEHKKRDYTGRYQNDCRPPLEKPVDAIFPRDSGVLAAPSTPVEIEVLGRKDFDPPWMINDNTEEWSKNVWDTERAERCQPLFRPADQEDSRLQSWVAFVNDPTGKKLAASRSYLCDEEAIWYFGLYSHTPKEDRIVIAKVTHSGDVLYRLSFKRPDVWGFIAKPTFIQKDGYLYFDWWDASTGVTRQVKKIMQVRVKVPTESGN